MKMPSAGPFAAGSDSKINVAVMRPTVNVREAENVGEEASALMRRNQEPPRFSKHGTFGPKVNTHPGLE